MAIFKNQRYASKVAAMLLAISVICTPGFSVSAQTVSDENSTNTETQVSDGGINGDIILPNGDTLKGDNEKIEVVKAVTVKIKVGTKNYKNYEVPQGTVKNALDFTNIKLGDDDTVSKKLSSKVKDGAKIKVNRVKYKTQVKKEKATFKTITKKTDNLFLGEKKVVRKGKSGSKKVTYTSKIVNGKVEKTVVTNTVITEKPVKKIVKVGTKTKGSMWQQNNTKFKTKKSGGVGTFLDINGKKVAYKQKITGQATAYSCGSVTATGDPVGIGGVAVNPNQIPYGSKLYIETTDGTIIYGYAVANDTGGFAYAGTATVDLFYNSESTCRTFGRRMVNIYVLA